MEKPAANEPQGLQELMQLCTEGTALAHLGLLAAGISVS